MSKYIDADAVIEELKKDFDREGAKADELSLKGLDDFALKYNHGQFCYLIAIEKIKDSPIIDVEQRIFELENRLKECENGYEGTLFLDRCKLHDAEEKIKELTQANEQLSESYDYLEKAKYELLAERSRLIEENVKLGDDNFSLICRLSRIKEDTVRLVQERVKKRIKGIYLDESEIGVIIDECGKQILSEMGEKNGKSD